MIQLFWNMRYSKEARCFSHAVLQCHALTISEIVEQLTKEIMTGHNNKLRPSQQKEETPLQTRGQNGQRRIHRVQGNVKKSSRRIKLGSIILMIINVLEVIVGISVVD